MSSVRYSVLPYVKEKGGDYSIVKCMKFNCTTVLTNCLPYIAINHAHVAAFHFPLFWKKKGQIQQKNQKIFQVFSNFHQKLIGQRTATRHDTAQHYCCILPQRIRQRTVVALQRNGQIQKKEKEQEQEQILFAPSKQRTSKNHCPTKCKPSHVRAAINQRTTCCRVKIIESVRS